MAPGHESSGLPRLDFIRWSLVSDLVLRIWTVGISQSRQAIPTVPRLTMAQFLPSFNGPPKAASSAHAGRWGLPLNEPTSTASGMAGIAPAAHEPETQAAELPVSVACPAPKASMGLLHRQARLVHHVQIDHGRPDIFVPDSWDLAS